MKLIFESLTILNENVTNNVVMMLLGTDYKFTTSSLKSASSLINTLLNRTRNKIPKNDNEFRRLRSLLNDELSVIKSLCKISDSNPKMRYIAGGAIYDAIKVGVIDNDKLLQYASIDKRAIKSCTEDVEDMILDYEDEVSDALETIWKKDLLDVFGDYSGNEFMLDVKTGNLYFFDHDDCTLTALNKNYEEHLIDKMDWIYECLSDDGLLIRI